MSDWNRSVRRWVARYGPPEIAGTAMAMVAWFIVDAMTGNRVAAAYGGSIGENLGFYGTFMLRSLANPDGDKAADGEGSPSRRVWRRARRTTTSAIVEFGPSEVLDTLLVRPLAMGLATAALGPQAGVFLGKIAADVVFYSVTIAGYELRRHVSR